MLIACIVYAVFIRLIWNDLRKMSVSLRIYCRNEFFPLVEKWDLFQLLSMESFNYFFKKRFVPQ